VQRCNRWCGLRGDARPPWPHREPRAPRKAVAQPLTLFLLRYSSGTASLQRPFSHSSSACSIGGTTTCPHGAPGVRLRSMSAGAQAARTVAPTSRPVAEIASRHLRLAGRLGAHARPEASRFSKQAADWPTLGS
jgi:hypothetical protein